MSTSEVHQLNGRLLREIGELGEGGFAFVLKVRDDNNGQEFALKKIVIQNKQIEALIGQEVKVWRQISGHPNIVRFVDCIQERSQGRVLILSELCSGGSLFDLINKYDGKLNQAQIIHIMIDICKGLSHMHAKGIAHRDIKVENILLHDKMFKLCDFGSASSQVLDHSVASPAKIEEALEEFEKYTTLMYRPPEMIDQYMKYKVDTKADVWMLGCVLFSMCFGYHPFQDSQMIGIVNAQYFMPANEYDRIPEKLRDLCRVLLVPNPAERPSVDQILKVLVNWNQLQQIPLSASAQRLKQKNVEQQTTSNKMKDLTYEDLNTMKEKIAREMEQKRQKKQHIPINQSNYIQNQGINRPAETQPIRQMIHKRSEQPSKQDDFRFDAPQQTNANFDFDFGGNSSSQPSGSNVGATFDFGSGGAVVKPSQQAPKQTNNSKPDQPVTTDLLDFENFSKQNEPKKETYMEQLSGLDFGSSEGKEQTGNATANKAGTDDFFSFDIPAQSSSKPANQPSNPT